MVNYIYDPDTDELIPTDSVKGKLLVKQARAKANAVVQSAGSEMSGGGVSSKPMGAPDPDRSNIVENRIPESPTDGSDSSDDSDGSDSSDGNKPKKLVSRVDNKDGTFTNTYDDGTTDVTGTKNASVKKLVSSVDNKDGTFTNTYDDGTTDVTGTKNASVKKLVSSVDNKDGTFTNTYDDGTTDVTGTKNSTVKKLVSSVDNKDGTFTNTYDDGTTDVTGTKNASGGSVTGIVPKTAEQLAAEALAAAKTADRKSAYDLLYEQFNKYGLGSLVEPLKGLITDPGVSPSEFTIKLRETEPYKQRFSANTQRIAKGLRSLNEAEYIGLEDQYQNIMRNYGLPDTYYTKGDLGRQPGFEKFIAGDVSPLELESRIQTAQNRVVKANPEVSAALKQFYPDISSGDILAYVLDPTNALENIKRKVSAAEIGGAALQQGLQTGVARAEQLASYGITKQMAEQGYGTIGGGLQRGSELSSIYGQPAYDQKTAEQEVFNLAGGTEAARERRKLTGLEKATFGGTTGLTGGALARERAGQY